MPLYREWSSDPYSLAAIWKIEEPESFFMEKTGLRPAIKAEKRRLEHLAGRFLLRHLVADFPLLHIFPDEHDKPRIAENEYYFSISHSFPYVAAVVSPYVECGIDIQVWHARIEQIQHKFLSDQEQSMIGTDPRMITLAWCAKEAAYKWQGRRGVEFIDHLRLKNLTTRADTIDISILLHLTKPQLVISAQCFVDQQFAFSLIVNKEVIHPLF